MESDLDIPYQTLKKKWSLDSRKQFAEEVSSRIQNVAQTRMEFKLIPSASHNS